jgi:Transposase
MCRPPLRVVCCRPKTFPCPACGKRGRRKRLLVRVIRSLAWRQEAFTEIRYAEYRSRCECAKTCSKTFRSWPKGYPPKAGYDDRVRQAVLDRLLDDGLNAERTIAAMRRDFLLDLSFGFLDDCLDEELRRIDLPAHRQRVLARFSGTLCVDELHLGRRVLLLATDPLSDEIVGLALVSANDQDHMRRFLLGLRAHGLLPRTVITDGSKLYPTVLAEVWKHAKHQLCVFHALQDLTAKALDAVRRLRRRLERKGKAGRKRKPGRPRKGARKRSKGMTCKEKAAFAFRHRHLVVKRAESLDEREKADLGKMLSWMPELRVLRDFCQEAYKAWGSGQSQKVARWRWTMLLKKAAYQAVPELKEALEGLGKGKLEKTLSFLEEPEGQRQKTNNHVERMNRTLRFDEKTRYKWRSRKSIVRWVLLRISRHVPKTLGQDG